MTRIYNPSTTVVTPISPSVAIWGDASVLTRGFFSVTPTNSPSLQIDFPADGLDTPLTIVIRQLMKKLAPGQTITGSQAIKAQMLVREFAAANNMFLAIAARVIAGDGSTLRKTILPVTADDLEAFTTAVRNRQFTATSEAGDYTTVPNDYLVIDWGASGDPVDASGEHRWRCTFGDDQGSDLPEDDTTQTDLRSWIEFADTLLFLDEPSGGRFNMFNSHIFKRF